MNRAAEETLKALGLERHQALIVAHRDKDHPHLHVIANRVNPETGKAAKLGNDRLKLSRWAERWERERGQVKCPERAKNNAERAKGGRFVRDRKSLHTARHRRERMRKAGPVRKVVPWGVWLHKPAHLEKWASMEREAFRQYQQARGPAGGAGARLPPGMAAAVRTAGDGRGGRREAGRGRCPRPPSPGPDRRRRRLATDSPGTGPSAAGRVRPEAAWSVEGGPGAGPACRCRRRPERSGRAQAAGDGEARAGALAGARTDRAAPHLQGGAPPRPRRVMCTAGRTWRRTGPPAVCRPWSGRSAKPPGRHRLNGCPIEARAATAAAASSADSSPDLYPSGARDRPLEALLRPVAFPKCPENGRWASRVREAEFRSPCGWAGPRTPCFAAPRRPMLRLQCGSLPTDLSLREGWPHA